MERLIQSLRGLLCPGILFALGTAACMTFLVSSPVAAQEDVFTVYDVEVDVRARTASRARDQALARAEAIAFKRLLLKLVGEDRANAIVPPAARDLRNMVRSIEIVEERSSATRYIAKLNISLVSDMVRRRIGRAGQRFSELRSAVDIIVPVMWRAGGALLAADENIWLEAWRQADVKNWLRAYRVPDNQALKRLTPRLALSGYDASALSQFRAASGGGNVLTVELQRDLSKAGHTQYTAILRRPGRNTPPERVRVRRFADDEDEAVVMARLIRQLLRRRDSHWRAQTLISFGDLQRVSARITVDEIGAWVRIRDSIRDMPLVRGLVVDWLALTESRISIEYIGGPEQLSLALAQIGLSLEERGGEWHISQIDESRLGDRN